MRKFRVLFIAAAAVLMSAGAGAVVHATMSAPLTTV